MDSNSYPIVSLSGDVWLNLHYLISAQGDPTSSTHAPTDLLLVTMQRGRPLKLRGEQARLLRAALATLATPIDQPVSLQFAGGHRVDPKTGLAIPPGDCPSSGVAEE